MCCFRLDVNLASTDQTGVSKPHATSGGARGGVGATTAGDGACATGATGEGATGGGATGGACAIGAGATGTSGAGPTGATGVCAAAANICGSKNDGRGGPRSISSSLDEESSPPPAAAGGGASRSMPATGTRRQSALPLIQRKTYSGRLFSTFKTPVMSGPPLIDEPRNSDTPCSPTIHSQMASTVTPSCASCAASSGDANADATAASMTAASYWDTRGAAGARRRRAGAWPAVVCAAASWTLASSWARLAVLASACPEIKLLRDDFNVNRRHLDHHTGVDPRRLQLRATARLPQISLLLKVFDAPRGFLGRGLRVALDLRRRGEEPFGGQDGQRRRGVELDQLRFLIVRGLLGRREQRVQAEERRPAWRSTSTLD